MRAAIRCAWLAAAMAVAVGCAAPESPRCKRVCDREAKCVARAHDDQLAFDESECVEACTSLERKPDGEHLVDEHVACVTAAQTCTAVLGCAQEP